LHVSTPVWFPIEEMISHETILSSTKLFRGKNSYSYGSRLNVFSVLAAKPPGEYKTIAPI
jgi:hypothetical protein